MGLGPHSLVTEAEIKAAAQRAGVEVVLLKNGHVQFKGKLLVNYYPWSKRLSAYVAGTRKAKTQCTPDKAARMACEAPPVSRGTSTKRKKTGARKGRLLKRHPFCHWCNAPLTKETATLEHVIPLARGGLDHMNNCTLACLDCNQRRGHDMPEIKVGVGE